MKQEKLDLFFSTLFRSGHLIQVVFSVPRSQEKTSPHKVICRPVSIQGRECFQFSEHFSQKVLHHNCSMEESLKRVFQYLSQFTRVVCFSEEADHHILMSRKGTVTLLEKKPTKKAKSSMHNREKTYFFSEGVPVPFLIELGLMTKEGRVIASKYQKFRQIQRFLEQVELLIEGLPQKHLSVVDFGCGKAYLTFALYHHLKEKKGIDVHLTGIDRKKEVITQCQDLAKKLHYQHLHFVEGDIGEFETSTPVDLVVALHACDTATDVALEKALHWQAKGILVVPCCQHELFTQIQQPLLAPILRHGLLRERFASLATDALRAQLLEVCGYETQVIEFVDHEDTPKNLMICAKRKPLSSVSSKRKEEYHALAKWLHVVPSLEKAIVD